MPCRVEVAAMSCRGCYSAVAACLQKLSAPHLSNALLKLIRLSALLLDDFLACSEHLAAGARVTAACTSARGNHHHSASVLLAPYASQQPESPDRDCGCAQTATSVTYLLQGVESGQKRVTSCPHALTMRTRGLPSWWEAARYRLFKLNAFSATSHSKALHAAFIALL